MQIAISQFNVKKSLRVGDIVKGNLQCKQYRVTDFYLDNDFVSLEELSEDEKVKSEFLTARFDYPDLETVLRSFDRITLDANVRFQGGNDPFIEIFDSQLDQEIETSDFRDFEFCGELAPEEIRNCPLNAFIIKNSTDEIRAIVVQ